MNKIAVLSFLITGLLITTIFVPSVLSDKKIQQDRDIADATVYKVDKTSSSIKKTSHTLNSKNMHNTMYESYTFTTVPNTPTPSNGATNVVLLYNSQHEGYKDLTFKWSDSSTTGRYIKYEILFGTTNPPTSSIGTFYIHSNGLFEKTVYVPSVSYDTEYYWKVIETYVQYQYNSHSVPVPPSPNELIVEGPVWSFTTESMYPPINPFPSDESTNIEVGSSILLKCDISHPHAQNVYVLTKISKSPDMSNILYSVSSGPFYITSEYTTITGNHHFTTEYDTVYYWQVGIKDSDNEIIYSNIWSFTTESFNVLDHISSAWSCATHTSNSEVKVVKFPVDFRSKFGVIEPRDQSHNINSDDSDMYIEIVFDTPIDYSHLHISINPSVPFEIQNSKPNVINIQFTSKIPNGVYHILTQTAKTNPRELSIVTTELFKVSYLNGDVNGDGIVNQKDVTEITNSNNWKNGNSPYQLPSLPPNMRCDINRNNMIEGLDIARVCNSFNMGQTIIQ